MQWRQGKMWKVCKMDEEDESDETQEEVWCERGCSTCDSSSQIRGEDEALPKLWAGTRRHKHVKASEDLPIVAVGHVHS